MARFRDLFEGEGSGAGPMIGEVLRRIEGVLTGPKDVNGSGDRSELLPKRPIPVVGEGPAYDFNRGGEQRRSLPFGIFATPVWMFGQERIH